jgi:nitroreductase
MMATTGTYHQLVAEAEARWQYSIERTEAATSLRWALARLRAVDPALVDAMEQAALELAGVALGFGALVASGLDPIAARAALADELVLLVPGAVAP